MRENRPRKGALSRAVVGRSSTRDQGRNRASGRSPPARSLRCHGHAVLRLRRRRVACAFQTIVLPSHRRDLYRRLIDHGSELNKRCHSDRDMTIVQGDAHYWTCFLPKNGGDDVRFFDWAAGASTSALTITAHGVTRYHRRSLEVGLPAFPCRGRSRHRCGSPMLCAQTSPMTAGPDCKNFDEADESWPIPPST
jgi:hypothetical protein